MKTFNVYIISYARANEVTVHSQLEYCTYVVRQSQAEEYRLKTGANVWGIDDDLISSFVKVNNYLIEHAPEDVIAVLDDDIENFFYRLEKNIAIKNPVDVSRELERLGQIIVDLDIGVMGSPILNIPYGYTAEINFSSMIGPIRFYNRDKVKGRYIEMPFFSDTDFALQEIMLNRIIFRPNYFVTDAKLERNSGGMNIRRTNKHLQVQADWMKKKWGKYFVYDTKKNITKIMVNR